MCDNNKKFELIVNTSTSCFLCYEETGSVNHKPFLFPLKSLCRHLGVNLSKTVSVDFGGGGTLSSTVPPSPSSTEKGGDGGGGAHGHSVQVQVSLCEGCWLISGSFSKLYRELEAIKMKLDICLEAIDDKLKGVEECPQLVEGYRRKLEGDEEAMRHSRMVTELRREIMLKYRSYNKKSQPRIKIKASSSPGSPMMGLPRDLRSTRDYLISYETVLATADMISGPPGPAEVEVEIPSKTETTTMGEGESLQSSGQVNPSQNPIEEKEEGATVIIPDLSDPKVNIQHQNQNRPMLKRMHSDSVDEVAPKKDKGVTPDIPTITVETEQRPPSPLPPPAPPICPRSLPQDQPQSVLNLNEDQEGGTSNPVVPNAHVRKQHHSTRPHPLTLESTTTTEQTSTASVASRHHCELCQGSFATQGGLSLHINRMHGISSSYSSKTQGIQIICDICKETFGSITQLRLHRENIHDQHLFTCKYCDKKCLTRIALLNHYMSVCSNPRKRQGQRGSVTSSEVGHPDPTEIPVVDIDEQDENEDRDDDDPAHLFSNLPITIEAVPDPDEHLPRTPPPDGDSNSPQITMVRSLQTSAEDNLDCEIEVIDPGPRPDPEIVTIDDTDNQTETSENIQSAQVQPIQPRRAPGPKSKTTWRKPNPPSMANFILESLQPSSHLPSILRRPGPRLTPTPPPLDTIIHVRSSFPCKLCEDRFNTMEGLKSHIKLRHMNDPRLQRMLSGIPQRPRPVVPAPAPKRDLPVAPAPPRRGRPPARREPPPTLPIQPTPCPSCTTVFTNEYWLREHKCMSNRKRVYKGRGPRSVVSGDQRLRLHQASTSSGSDVNDSEPIVSNPEPIIIDFNYPDEDDETNSEEEQMEVDNISTDPLA